MPTRFYFDSVTTPAISPAFDSNWEQTGQAVRRRLQYKQTVSVLSALTDFSVTIPITTTQDILVAQFISEPLGYNILMDARTFSMVVGKCGENATTNNAHLAFSLRVLSNDGSVSRGTLRSSFTTISEFPLIASAATRIIAAAAITPVTTQIGDRICLEVGVRANSPTAAGTGQMRFGTAGGSDFALTTALTTDLNGWCEFEQNIFNVDNENYKSIKSTSGWVNERIR
jgi:hypothetical protein